MQFGVTEAYSIESSSDDVWGISWELANANLVHCKHQGCSQIKYVKPNAQCTDTAATLSLAQDVLHVPNVSQLFRSCPV